MRPMSPRARGVLIALFATLGVWNLAQFGRAAWAGGHFAPVAGDWFDLALGVLELAFVATLVVQWRRERGGR